MKSSEVFIIAGVILILLGFLAPRVIPIKGVSMGEELVVYTVEDLHNICNSGLGKMTQIFGQDIKCFEINLAMNLSYAIIIIGAVMLVYNIFGMRGGEK